MTSFVSYGNINRNIFLIVVAMFKNQQYFHIKKRLFTFCDITLVQLDVYYIPTLKKIVKILFKM